MRAFNDHNISYFYNVKITTGGTKVVTLTSDDSARKIWDKFKLRDS